MEPYGALSNLLILQPASNESLFFIGLMLGRVSLATSERPLIVDLWVPRMLAGQFPLSPAQSSRAARNINYSYRVMILQGHYCYNFSQS